MNTKDKVKPGNLEDEGEMRYLDEQLIAGSCSLAPVPIFEYSKSWELIWVLRISVFSLLPGGYMFASFVFVREQCKKGWEILFQNNSYVCIIVASWEILHILDCPINFYLEKKNQPTNQNMIAILNWKYVCS